MKPVSPAMLIQLLQDLVSTWQLDPAQREQDQLQAECGALAAGGSAGLQAATVTRGACSLHRMLRRFGDE